VAAADTPATPLPDAMSSGLAKERIAALAYVRNLVNDALPPGYVEGVQGKMIVWSIPLERYPRTYNKQPLQLAALAAQKNHNSLYLTGLYMSPERTRRFERAFAASGKKLDMGKSCVRFRSAEELDDDAISEAIASLSVDDYLAEYEASRSR
jgi:uncharacterized protein YdhG (YjbR/CyaY superfamily)